MRVKVVISHRGESRIFFRRGCTRLLLYFSTRINHIVFFCRIPVVLENRKSSQGGGGGRTPCTLPLDPSLSHQGFVTSILYSTCICIRCAWKQQRRIWVLSIQPKVQFEFRQLPGASGTAFSKISKERRTWRGIPKFWETFSWKFSFHSTLLPEFLKFSTELFTFRKFNSFRNFSWEFLYHLLLFPNFWNFWFIEWKAPFVDWY